MKNINLNSLSEVANFAQLLIVKYNLKNKTNYSIDFVFEPNTIELPASNETASINLFNIMAFKENNGLNLAQNVAEFNLNGYVNVNHENVDSDDFQLIIDKIAILLKALFEGQTNFNELIKPLHTMQTQYNNILDDNVKLIETVLKDFKGQYNIDVDKAGGSTILGEISIDQIQSDTYTEELAIFNVFDGLNKSVADNEAANQVYDKLAALNLATA